MLINKMIRELLHVLTNFDCIIFKKLHTIYKRINIDPLI